MALVRALLGLAFFALPAQALQIAADGISLSGVSSGAYIAGQMHVAHSSLYHGVGLVAGGLIDDLNYLKSSQVYIFSGTGDQAISTAVVAKNVEFYRSLGVSESQIQFVAKVPATHGFPTLGYGNDCGGKPTSPFMSRCDYDTAGAILRHIYGDLKAPVAAKSANFMWFAQSRFAGGDLADISMGPDAAVYVPTGCRHGASCRLHVAFHGCSQTRDQVGDQFIHHAGYNEWAEAKNVVILYPQAVQSSALGNPYGCWDWWGYTGPKFATRDGAQVQVVQNMVRALRTDRNIISRLRPMSCGQVLETH